jgi:hypothetical protein
MLRRLKQPTATFPFRLQLLRETNIHCEPKLKGQEQVLLEAGFLLSQGLITETFA